VYFYGLIPLNLAVHRTFLYIMLHKFGRPFQLALSAITIFTAVFLLAFFNTKEIGENESEKTDGMDKAWQQEFEMTKDPSLGYVPKERLIPALAYTKTILAQRGGQAIPNIEWRALGPKNYGGRTRTLLVDLNDATRKTVWAGSVGGGLWKTSDITVSEPNWLPITDLFGNLAITSIAQDPTNTQNIYFGTGEGYSNSDAIRGLGIWKTSDGGNTWSQLSATNNSTFYYNFKVFVNSTGVLFACTTSGLYRSANGGTSFTKVLGTGLGISGANSNTNYDIEEAANGDMYATLNGSLHKSVNGGVSWGSALPIGINAQRIEVATAPGNSNYVYVLSAYNNSVGGIALSTDGGASFTTKTKPTDSDPGIGTDFTRGQAWYDLTIAVSPTDPLSVFVGGVDLFKSSDGAASWGQIAHWYGGFSMQNVHADQHNIIFSPGSGEIIYFVNDGAIYRATNASAPVPSISYKSANYNTLQFYSCGMDPAAGTYNFIAGAQDNGSHKFTQQSLANTLKPTGGDGGFCHIDQNESQYWFTSYTNNTYSRSTNGGTSFTDVSYSSSNGRFINPTDYDDAGNMMYACHSTNNYLRWNNPQSGNSFTVVPCTELGGNISAVKVSPNTPNRVFFGSGSGGNIVRVDNANAATPTATIINSGAGMPAAYVSCIEVEPGEDNHILVTYSNYGVNSIWETTNGGTTWNSVEGNLPDMPVRWVIFNPTNGDQALIATELGVWSTDDLNGASTVWGTTNNGLANVRVDMLQSRASDKLIIAATHGRGLYYTAAFAPASASFVTTAMIVYPGRALQFTNTSNNATSLAWDFGDGTTSVLQNPLKKFNNPGIYTVSLSINGGASTATKTVTVMPWSGTPYTLAQGGNLEVNPAHFAAETISGTGWEKGNSVISAKSGTNSGSNAWVTGLTGNYVDNSESYLYSPSYNLTTGGTYTLSFYTKHLFESDYDGYRVEYSIDTGKNWTVLNPVMSANWYNSRNNSGTSIFPAGQAFFSGTVSAFTQKSCDISFLAGNNQVAFRFAFKSDEGLTAAGAAIDDIVITGASNNPLPLELLNFTATKENKDAFLQWNTANEVNVSHFEIERSWNGTEFSSIAKKAAQNGLRNTYALKDLLSNLSNRPSNITYYRLKMVDKDGKYKYSNTEVLKWSDLQNSKLSITPNPFNSYIQVNTLLKISRIQLIDNSGSVLASSASLNNGRFNVPPVPTGTYYLRIYTAEGVITEKVVKQ
jgi:PKD repeat protein